MPKPFRWALVGASDIAATRMIPAMRRLGQVPAVVMSTDPARAAEYARTHGIERWTTSLTDALAADVDAVYISTTNGLHAGQLRAVIAAGRHVLCEKPLALAVNEAQDAVLAAAAGRVLMGTNHHLRSSPVIRCLKQAVADGAVGHLLAIRVPHAVLLPQRLRGWRLGTMPGAGVILDLTVHDIDAVRYVSGLEVLDVAAVGLSQGLAQGTTPDAVMVAGRLTEEVGLQIHAAYTAPHAVTGFEVHGTDGSLYGTKAMKQEPDGDVVLCRSGHDDVAMAVPAREPLYERTIRIFAGAVAGDGEPTASGADGVRSLAVALAIQQSVQTGQTIHVRYPDGA